MTGDTGDLMYVVLKGEVDIVINDKIVETVRHGGMFGEMALIDNHVRSAGAWAKTPVEAVSFDKQEFLKLLGTKPDFAIEVMRVMAERLRLLNSAVL
jgi:CRP/FNR family transcriptional regulator, cyclic AMP receptor protein